MGIIFAVTILGTYYYYFTKEYSKTDTVASAKSLLQKNGFIVLTSTEYKQIKNTPETQTNNTAKTDQPPNANQPVTIEAYRLNITAGMSPGSIAKLLAQQKIIDNAADFTQYLINHHEQTNIQLGTYDLTSKMDNEQIAKIITKSK